MRVDSVLIQFQLALMEGVVKCCVRTDTVHVLCDTPEVLVMLAYCTVSCSIIKMHDFVFVFFACIHDAYI